MATGNWEGTQIAIGLSLISLLQILTFLANLLLVGKMVASFTYLNKAQLWWGQKKDFSFLLVTLNYIPCLLFLLAGVLPQAVLWGEASGVKKKWETKSDEWSEWEKGWMRVKKELLFVLSGYFMIDEKEKKFVLRSLRRIWENKEW
jgi:hypothetical protein